MCINAGDLAVSDNGKLGSWGKFAVEGFPNPDCEGGQNNYELRNVIHGYTFDISPRRGRN